jgi:hypothetical protein
VVLHTTIKPVIESKSEGPKPNEQASNKEETDQSFTMNNLQTLGLVLGSILLLVTYSTVQIAAVLILLQFDGHVIMDAATLRAWLPSAIPILYLPVPVFYGLILLTMLSCSGHDSRDHTTMTTIEATDGLLQRQAMAAAKELSQILPEMDKKGDDKV